MKLKSGELTCEQDDLFELITRVGDRTGLEGQLSDLQAAILASDAEHDFVLETLLKCISQLTVKTSIYSTALLLINRDAPELVEKCVGRAVAKLVSDTRENEWCSASLLVRFLCDLVNVKLVDPADVFLFLEILLDECAPERPVQRQGTFAYLVMAALPWCAKVLHEADADALDRIFDRLGTFFATRKQCQSAQIFTAGSGCTADTLDVAWYQLNAFRKTHFVVTSIVKPYILPSVEEVLRDPGRKHAIPKLELPAHELGFIYYDLPSALHIFYEWDEVRGAQVETQLVAPTGPGADKDAAEAVGHFNERLRIRPVDRLIVQQYITDTLFFWNSSREDCVKRLRLLPVKASYEHLVVEGVLAHLFMLPQTPFCPMLYSAVLVDLCKIDFNYPVVIAEAIEVLYDRVPRMDNEIVDRFVQFFAFHLANFGFKWIWEDWAAVLERDELNDRTCKKLFIYEVFSQMLRHSYKERLLGVIPAVLHRFIPDAPRHCFKWDVKMNKGRDPPPFRKAAESIYTSIQSGQFTADELTLELDRLDWHSDMQEEDKVEILTHCLLINGIETISHQRNVLSRYRAALRAVCQHGTDSAQLRLKIIQCACAFWENSPQHKLIAIHQLLDLEIVEGVDVVQWLFTPGVIQFWERQYPWEAVRNTLDRLINEIHDKYRDLCALQKRSAAQRHELADHEQQGDGGSEEANVLRAEVRQAQGRIRQLYAVLNEEKVAHLRQCFFALFKGFRDFLQEHYHRTDAQLREAKQPGSRAKAERQQAKDYVWHKSAVSHFLEMGRKYLMFIFPWLDELKSELFANCDSRVTSLVDALTDVLHRRWSVAKGVNSANVQTKLTILDLQSLLDQDAPAEEARSRSRSAPRSGSEEPDEDADPAAKRRRRYDEDDDRADMDAVATALHDPLRG